ncbi:MAG: preprotein translocase subunit SecA [Erysipelotrichaceae bacterium]|nr:preprotein translocase subunit SecA [Erysipelotrichaceae bacterium]
MGIIEKLFNGDGKQVEVIKKQALEVDALSAPMAVLSDDQLKAKTLEFRSRLTQGETLDDLLVEAFAVAREAAKRVIGEYPYLVQIMGGIVLHKGDIAEMKTGEGKTLTSVLPVYLNALGGQGVHIITVNEYLAERDSKWMGSIHRFLGLTVGLNLRRLVPSEKRAQYLCDITYTTNAESGFDYLRDNMVTKVNDRVLRPLNMALVDEVDSILIDESRTPLIISGGQRQTANLYLNADRFVKSLKENEGYEIDLKARTVQLTEKGVALAEKLFKVENLYHIQHTNLVHHLHQALKANYVMGLDVDYVVQDKQVVIVDQFTGRMMTGRVFSDGLHQAIEAKEGVPIKQETSTMATITYQNYFRLYKKLCGMTGTAKTEEEEFLSIYNMRVLAIPTNKPVVRIDMPDAVFGSRKSKFQALLAEVQERHAMGQPMLIGTIAVETSEFISKILTQNHLRHEVLNAKNHAREADIIAKAGQKGSITIATNMAGRGTDIKLGEGVRELGGLAVIGSERHESRRIDNQLRGRSGRQGDPGYSRFFVSVQDELMVRFGSERYESLFARLGDQAVESKLVTNSITNAQKRVEGVNFDVRKTLLEYDDVLRQQREIIYGQRNYILEHDDVHSLIEDMFTRVIDNLVNAHIIRDGKDKLHAEDLINAFEKIGFKDLNISEADLNGLELEKIHSYCKDKAWAAYEAKLEPIRQYGLGFEKNVVLTIVDRSWQEHIDTMSKLREGIHLRSYAQSKPLQAYVEEGYQLFEEMMNTIASEVLNFCMRMRIEIKENK